MSKVPAGRMGQSFTAPSIGEYIIMSIRTSLYGPEARMVQTMWMVQTMDFVRIRDILWVATVPIFHHLLPCLRPCLRQVLQYHHHRRSRHRPHHCLRYNHLHPFLPKVHHHRLVTCYLILEHLVQIVGEQQLQIAPWRGRSVQVLRHVVRMPTPDR
jgi:hypothetical protein